MNATLWNEGWLVSIINHLWQSTLVVLLALLLTWVLKRNQARTRYWVWMTASAKLLVPFSLFVAIGERLRPSAAPLARSPQFASAILNLAQPFSANLPNRAPVPLAEPAMAALPSHQVSLLPALFLTVWLSGSLLLLLRWLRHWWAIRAAVRSASPMPLPADVPILSSSLLLEPGVFGIFRPVLLLPDKILGRLSAPQLRSILAHEMCHVRRRDNLTAAVHMIVGFRGLFDHGSAVDQTSRQTALRRNPAILIVLPIVIMGVVWGFLLGTPGMKEGGDPKAWVKSHSVLTVLWIMTPQVLAAYLLVALHATYIGMYVAGCGRLSVHDCMAAD